MKLIDRPGDSGNRSKNEVIMIEHHENSFTNNRSVVSAKDGMLGLVWLEVWPVVRGEILEECLAVWAPDSHLEEGDQSPI